MNMRTKRLPIDLPVRLYQDGALNAAFLSVEAAVCFLAAQTGLPYDFVWEATEHGPFNDDGTEWAIWTDESAGPIEG